MSNENAALMPTMMIVIHSQVLREAESPLSDAGSSTAFRALFLAARCGREAGFSTAGRGTAWALIALSEPARMTFYGRLG